MSPFPLNWCGLNVGKLPNLQNMTPTRNPQENAPTYKITKFCVILLTNTPNFHSSFFSLLFFLDCSAVQSQLRGLRSRPDSKETSFLENEWGIRILMSYDGVLSSINLVSSCNLIFGSLDLWMWGESDPRRQDFFCESLISLKNSPQQYQSTKALNLQRQTNEAKP